MAQNPVDHRKCQLVPGNIRFREQDGFQGFLTRGKIEVCQPGAIEDINLVNSGNIKHGVKSGFTQAGIGLFQTFSNGSLLHGFTIFKKAAGQCPETLAGLNSPAAEQDSIVVDRYAPGYDTRVLVVDPFTSAAHVPVSVIPGWYTQNHGIAAVTAIIHKRISLEISCHQYNGKRPVQPLGNDVLDTVRERLKGFPPETRSPKAEDNLRNAAVLMALTREEDPAIVFIKRALHLNSHSGQVALPGGMWEPEDRNLLETALRESYEEIALPPAQVDVLAMLPPRHTRFDICVTPYVGLIPPGLELVPEPGELEALFLAPLSYLSQAANLTTTRFTLFDVDYEVSCFFYQGFCIWGFTLGILADFLWQVAGVRLDLQFKKLLGPT